MNSQGLYLTSQVGSTIPCDGTQTSVCSFTSRGCPLKFYFSKKIIGQLFQNNTLTAWLRFHLPTYDFNSYGIGHWGKITVFSYSQSDVSPGCVVVHDQWWNQSAWLFENMFPWHKYIGQAPGSTVHSLFIVMAKFPEIVSFIFSSSS